MILKCEQCHSVYTEKYGSGRFCSEKCARGFSTKLKRAEINEKVSVSLAGRAATSVVIQSEETKNKRKRSWTDENRAKAAEIRRRQAQEIFENTPFEKMGKSQKKRYVLKEQNGKCDSCGLSEWMGKPMIFELDHIDGDHSNNHRSNFRCLCPNCHSMTDTWRKRKQASVAKR